MIPKRVHYVWVGRHPMPDKNARLLERNQHFLAGYEVKVWSEQDLDLTPPFVQRAYAEKRWAFVSDYVRFVLLRDRGGIYLDTDQELLRPLDELLDVPGFAGISHPGDLIYCGVIGVVANHPLMQQLVRDYDELAEGQWPTSPMMFTAAYKKLQPEGFVIHPYHAFYPVDEGRQPDPALLAKAYAVHHWDESWRRFVPLRRLLRRLGIIPLYHQVRRVLSARK